MSNTAKERLSGLCGSSKEGKQAASWLRLMDHREEQTGARAHAPTVTGFMTAGSNVTRNTSVAFLLKSLKVVVGDPAPEIVSTVSKTSSPRGVLFLYAHYVACGLKFQHMLPSTQNIFFHMFSAPLEFRLRSPLSRCDCTAMEISG